MNIIEYIRKKSIESIFNLSSFSNPWEASWRAQVLSKLSTYPYNPNSIIDLGDHLSQIFKTTSSSGRTQSLLSGAGTAWEALVNWYLNICLIGTNVVVFRQNEMLMPTPIKEAVTVHYGNYPSNTEADLIGLTFPNEVVFFDDIRHVIVKDRNDDVIPNLKNNNDLNYNKIINSLCEIYFDKIEVAIIQCKTNWNDNSQIPMLWDMVYSANGFSERNIIVGSSQFSISNLNKFSYSFVTVPSNNVNYSSNSLAVKRVISLSGGNYWGKPSQRGVASSIKEIFGVNFRHGAGNITSSLEQGTKKLKYEFSYFDI